jgi:hypothetical protein
MAHQPRRFGMFSARKLILAASFLSLAGAWSLLVPLMASGQTIDLSLNVFYNSPSNVNSGGTWELVAKSSNFGIAGLQARITSIDNAFDFAPIATVNGNQLAGFNADAQFFNPASGSTPGYNELDFGQAPFDSLSAGQEQGIFYGVGQLANGAPNYPGKPIGSNSEGPAFTTLTQPFGIPWATGDVFGNPAWNTGAEFAVGSFSAGFTPAFVAGSNGNVFTVLGTSTSFGTVAAATVTTIVRTNFAALTADYNHNGVVDMADYVLWRHTLNQNVTPGSGADGNGNGVVDQADYAVWRANFGTGSPGAGSGSLSTSAVPEPFSAVLLAFAGAMFCCVFRPRRLRPALAANGYRTPRVVGNRVQ